MEIYTSQSIIMRTAELGESDLLVTFFTQDRGRLKGVAKGARRSRRRFVNSLDIFSLVEMEYSLRRKGSLHLLQSARLIEAFPTLRTDYSIMARASYMIELTETLFPWELSDQRMFKVLKDSFHLLDQQKDPDMVWIIFELTAMSLGGYGIDLDRCCICGRGYTGKGTAVFRPDKGGIACMNCEKTSSVSPPLSPTTITAITRIRSDPYNSFKISNIPNEMVTEIKPVLRLHREYHLGKRLKTARYLE